MLVAIGALLGVPLWILLGWLAAGLANQRKRPIWLVHCWMA